MSGRPALRVWGRVARETRFALDDLAALPQVEIAIESGALTGVPTREILGRIQLDPAAAWVLAHGESGASRCLRLVDFAAADSLLVLGAPEGGPLRLVLPRLGHRGCVNGLSGLEMLAKRWTL
jgi:DMSO/TMAO reductase YedYZ molybdopterin-dependent catalytic subunit